MISYRDSGSEKGRKILLGVILVLAGLAAGLLISRVFVTPFIVAGDSMSPGFKPGQRLIFFRYAEPKFGDIVLMDDPASSGKVFIKRVIGVSGDTLEMKNQVIYRNSNKLRMNWPTLRLDSRNFPMGFSHRDNMPLVKLSRNEYFVINDNIDDSYDGRTFGAIKHDAIRGTLIYIFP